MNRKETSLLVESWKNFLNESTESRILKMIDTIENSNHKIKIIDYGDDIKVLYVNNEGESIEYEESSDFDKINNSHNDKRIYGSIWCVNNEKRHRYAKNDLKNKLPAIGEGEKNSCWHINLTDTTTIGLGPLLYEVLIEYVTKEKNAAVKPDGSSVSISAKNVWQKYENRSDIKKIKLDIFQDHADSDDEIESLTPNNIADDCIQNSAIKDKGKSNWSESCLSLGYRKESPVVIKALMQRKLILLPKKSNKILRFLKSRWNQIKNLF